MEYLLLQDGSVRVVPEIDTYDVVEALLKAEPGIKHYWLSREGVWRVSYLSSMGARRTDRLDVDPPDMVKLAAMLE